MKSRFLAEFARALRNRRFERMPDGLLFADQRVVMGGFFEYSADGGAWTRAKNTACLEGLDDLLSTYFNSGSPPTAFYLAPFSNNVQPTSALKAATFASTQGEYTGYTESTRQLWVPDGPSAGQTMSNSEAPAEFTIGASAASIAGGGLIAGAGAKGATAGKLIAAAQFPVANTMGAGSTIKIKYTFGATPAA